MSEERNRRTLAFRGGGGSSLSGVTLLPTTAAPAVLAVPVEEPTAWPPRQLNGRLREAEEEEVEVELEPEGPDDEEEAEVLAVDLARREAEDGGSLSSGSTEEDDEDDDEEDEGGSPGSGLSDKRSGDGGEDAEVETVEEEERPARRRGLAPARPQSLLHGLHSSSFQDSWLREFPWLRFCQETGLMCCAWCRQEDGSGRDELCKGTRNYKRPLLLRHHLSAEHRLNDPDSQKPEIKEEPTEGCSDYSVKPNENSYCYQLLQELNDQRKKGILCDVNIVVSGKVFRAHKNILVAGSRFFKTLYCFTNKESRDQTTVTYLDVVAIQGFSVILDFMYSGNLVLTSQNAIEVMSVASYLQMTEVVHSCRNFIKDALNISIKSEAPEAVVVNYNKSKAISRDGLPSRDQKIASFWATRNLTNLASNIKIENDIGSQTENQQNDSWFQDNLPDVKTEPEGQGKVFVWNDVASPSMFMQEPSKGRRKNQTTKRYVYNIPPTTDEVLLENASMLLPSPVPYQDEEVQCFQDGAGTSRELKYEMFPESWPREPWENGDSSSMLMNKLKCPHCNYVAKYRRTLKRHLLIHTGVRSFSCEICGKLFTRREHVKRHSLVHKKDKKYKCMVCKKIFMLAASVGIRHGSRRYGVCVECVDKSQPGMQDGVDQVQDTDFSRDEEFEENDAVETVDPDDDLVEDGEDQTDPSQWEEQQTASQWEEQIDPPRWEGPNAPSRWEETADASRWEESNDPSRWEQSADVCMTIDD
ncbi:zinc finger and BTB domain-containing protein 10 [Ambystoma mexicanum]|uniref:zinc finger and BTB domain-containing protein 10 n=1 Tax=Ambystoma mexicanum TaxID=8296 RepID=UPI0037E7EB03